MNHVHTFLKQWLHQPIPTPNSPQPHNLLFKTTSRPFITYPVFRLFVTQPPIRSYKVPTVPGKDQGNIYKETQPPRQPSSYTRNEGQQPPGLPGQSSFSSVFRGKKPLEQTFYSVFRGHKPSPLSFSRTEYVEYVRKKDQYHAHRLDRYIF